MRKPNYRLTEKTLLKAVLLHYVGTKFSAIEREIGISKGYGATAVRHGLKILRDKYGVPDIVGDRLSRVGFLISAKSWATITNICKEAISKEEDDTDVQIEEEKLIDLIDNVHTQRITLNKNLLLFDDAVLKLERFVKKRLK